MISFVGLSRQSRRLKRQAAYSSFQTKGQDYGWQGFNPIEINPYEDELIRRRWITLSVFDVGVPQLPVNLHGIGKLLKSQI